MPLYRFTCPECGKTDSVFRKISQRNQQPKCDCGTFMGRNIKAERKGAHTFTPYVDHNLSDKPIKVESYNQKRQLKKEAGVREAGSYVE